ncbi:GntR family transcriptional regulator [Bosea sp. (in: a-proteobacteria)]|uniref:GntR family transcriptional regulator n=1 Tax=Bosea sp. (in: a-proteobacteria) TaxID=1871050 RepID=UPI002FC7D5FD
MIHGNQNHMDHAGEPSTHLSPLLRLGATTSMQVAADLRRRILQGELVPGQRLKINEIAAICQVSHMPVRTALQELEAEGIVELHPHRGAEIRSIDARYIKNVLDVRAAIEVMLTGQCAAIIDDAGVATLDALVLDFEEKAATRDPTAMLRCNFRLHNFINRLADNSEALRVLDRGRLLIEAVRVKYAYGGSRVDKIVSEHRLLRDAIARHDVKASREIAQRHCEGARNELLKLLQGNLVE